MCFDDEPGDEFEVGLFVDLLLRIRQDEAATGLEAGGSAFAEGGGEGVHGFLQERGV